MGQFSVKILAQEGQFSVALNTIGAVCAVMLPSCRFPCFAVLASRTVSWPEGKPDGLPR